MMLRHLSILIMADLGLALVVMTATSIGLFFFTCRLTRRLSHKARVAVVAIVTVAIIVFASFFFDSRWLLVILPFQAAIIYGNFFMPLFAVLAGVLWKSTRTPAWRRLPLIVACVIGGSGSAIVATTARTPSCTDNWHDTVCLQTSQSTCTAAAAATLLRYYGIGATEQEMARLCLTRERGTYLHGLYRGLRSKTQRTQYRVLVGSTSIARLHHDVALPVILNIKLTKAANQRDPRYSRDWGWKVGVAHTVVLFGFSNDGLVDMGEPGVGREFWDMQALRDLWHGEYICLEKTN